MNALYMLNGISKQEHFDALKRLNNIQIMERCYVGYIETIREMHPGMGLRKMYEQFQPEDIVRDAFISLGLREGYRISTIVKKPYKTTWSVKNNRYHNLLKNKRFTDVNQLWVSDIFYFPIQEEHYYVVLLMDVYSRKIVGHCVADNMRVENNIKALQIALILRGIKNYEHKLIHHSDRDSQYVGNDYTNILETHNIQISMCNDVLENAHCERANGTIKNEYLKRWDITTFERLKTRLAMAVRNYNNRKHNTLAMMPNQYEVLLQTLPKDKRKEISIFTISKAQKNTLQIELFENY